jgi:hypothetical protein
LLFQQLLLFSSLVSAMRMRWWVDLGGSLGMVSFEVYIIWEGRLNVRDEQRKVYILEVEPWDSAVDSSVCHSRKKKYRGSHCSHKRQTQNLE